MTLSPQRLEKAARVTRPDAFKKCPVEDCQDCRDAQESALTHASAVISAYLGDDMVVVPREPTEAMVDAAYESFGCHEIFRVEEIQPGDLYRAMLSAELTERDAG
jgi:hypothetical protein